MTKIVLFSLITLLLSALLLFKPNSIIELCDVETCPICFGVDICEKIKDDEIALKYSSISDIIFNFFSVKNVYFASYNGNPVVLKKLTHNRELLKLQIRTYETPSDILNFLLSDDSSKSFKVCDRQTANLFLNSLSDVNIQFAFVILQVNAEPILLQLFDSGNWPVPKLYGFCGRLVIIEDTGKPLANVEDYDWLDRCYIAFQILLSARNFTENHNIFRLYLTDISPDNIVVDEKLKVSFVDFENAILTSKIRHGMHYSEHFADEAYAYSEKSICEKGISDHNIYSVCKLILSQYSPWPMMQNGLLHNPPIDIMQKHSDLFENIEKCVYSVEHLDRFQLSEIILYELKLILSKHNYFNNVL